MSKVLVLLKELGSNKKNNIAIKVGLVFVLISILTAVILFSNYSDDVSKGLADNLIRFHVIANSDSTEDQAIKRDVRDVVINYMKLELKDSRDIEQTKFIINTDKDKIIQLAKDEIAKKGKNYSVNMMLGSYPFPTKIYGDITLPSGYYQALRIVIGKGEGANWWCVLFPPLCFVDATHGTVPESVKADLKKALTNEEYKIITSDDNGKEIPIRIKFKIVEFFQDSKLKFAGLFSKIFGTEKKSK